MTSDGPRDVFDIVLVPKEATGAQKRTYVVPRPGDLLTGFDVKGTDVGDVRVEIMGETVWTGGGCGAVPLRINLMKLGYHTAEIHVTGEDVTVTATVELIASLEERRRIATSADSIWSLASNM